MVNRNGDSPRRLLWILLLVLLVTTAAFGLSTVLALTKKPEPALPPLLRDVSAAGGTSSACLPERRGKNGLPFALSPELNQRLSHEFPPGSPADRLKKALLQQGFQMLPACENDRSIHVAIFDQHGAGFFGPYPIHAVIYWKVDRANGVAWTKGFVDYTGP
jgi:hypothetical protein